MASGDPIGDETQFPALVADFAALCHSRGWRMAVLACSERRLGLWDPWIVGQSLQPIPIGGDVVVGDVPRRRRGAPNAIDERLSIDMITAAKEQGAQRVSLAFARFPSCSTATARVGANLVTC